MSKCTCCNREMTNLKTTSCTETKKIIFGDFSYDPIPYGKETRYKNNIFSRCHDCGVMPNKIHHNGCDVEECPRCSRQLISCNC